MNRAIADYDRVIQINPEYATVYFHRGNAKLALKQYDAAIDDYNKALRISPDNREVIRNRTFALEQKQSKV